MVVGAGSLGNEVLKNLALMNVGKIIIIDFDRIESSNLNRSVLYRAEDAEAQSFKSEIAARKIMEINPNVRAIAINADITCQVGLGLFRRCDVIIGCLDNRLASISTGEKLLRMWSECDRMAEYSVPSRMSGCGQPQY